jgi:hypothetical protein
MAVMAAAIVVRGIVRHRRMFRGFLVRWLFVGRLLVGIAVAVAVIGVAGFILPLAGYRVGAAQRAATAVQLVLALVA